ncbi:MAG: hypothetical protein IJN50_01775 [Clostridia bacterium]|nr:hypothetical protein [Clostridia bacterium]
MAIISAAELRTIIETNEIQKEKEFFDAFKEAVRTAIKSMYEEGRLGWTIETLKVSKTFIESADVTKFFKGTGFSVRKPDLSDECVVYVVDVSSTNAFFGYTCIEIGERAIEREQKEAEKRLKRTEEWITKELESATTKMAKELTRECKIRIPKDIYEDLICYDAIKNAITEAISSYGYSFVRSTVTIKIFAPEV